MGEVDSDLAGMVNSMLLLLVVILRLRHWMGERYIDGILIHGKAG